MAREVAQKAEAERKAKEKEEREREEMMANMNPTQRRMFLEHQAQLEKEKEVCLIVSRGNCFAPSNPFRPFLNNPVSSQALWPFIDFGCKVMQVCYSVAGLT